jgi:allantoin racemase
MIVNPNTTAAMTDDVLAGARRAAAPGTELVGATAATGVPTVESNLDEVHGALAVAAAVQAGEAEGIDGYVVACFGDTGVAAAKELAAGPAVGMTEAALSTAALIAHRFTVVTLPPRTLHQSQRVVAHLGLIHRCTIRAIDAGVADVAAGAAAHLEAVAGAAKAALTDDGAEAVLLGCAGMAALVGPLTAILGVPVIEGVAAGVTMVEGLLRQGLTTSRHSTYARAGS